MRVDASSHRRIVASKRIYMDHLRRSTGSHDLGMRPRGSMPPGLLHAGPERLDRNVYSASLSRPRMFRFPGGKENLTLFSF